MILEDAYVQFIIEHKLTQSQYLLLHLIYKNRGDLIKKYKDVFPSDDKSMIGTRMTQDLFDRGFLEKNHKDEIVIGKVFLEAFIDKHSASEEVFNTYPTHFEKDGVPIPLSAMDRNVFANLYDKAIQSSLLEHLEVMEDIKFGIQEKMLCIGLDKFLKSKYWLVLRPKRLANQIKIITKTKMDNEF